MLTHTRSYDSSVFVLPSGPFDAGTVPGYEAAEGDVGKEQTSDR